tara:strand:- start:2443 stop:3171 length:729 start_codon:yes stop_codon:yes gene_type:complete
MSSVVEENELFEFEETEEVEQSDEERPSMLSAEWNGYVMSMFFDNELIEGNPICAGLRRVAELVLGPIIQSGPTQVIAATDADGPGRATVVFEIIFASGYTVSEVADVWHGNTDDLFCAHPVATASTRAEGRALRKALKLICLAAEELAKKDIASIVKEKTSAKTTDGGWNPEASITVQQKNFLESKCKQLNVDLAAFVNSGEGSYDSIDKVTKDKASVMIKTLNKYQNGQLEIPQEIRNEN